MSFPGEDPFPPCDILQPRRRRAAMLSPNSRSERIPRQMGPLSIERPHGDAAHGNVIEQQVAKHEREQRHVSRLRRLQVGYQQRSALLIYQLVDVTAHADNVPKARAIPVQSPCSRLSHLAPRRRPGRCSYSQNAP